MKILKFNEGFFGKYDVDITDKKDKDGFVRYAYEYQFKLTCELYSKSFIWFG
jgi:hypothetical protein